LQLVQLQGAQSRFREHGIGLVAVSYDSQAILKEFSDRHGITYPLLADPESTLIKRFGVLNGKATDFMKGMALPGYVYISRDARIRHTFFEQNYRERYTANSVIAKLFPELVESDVRTFAAPHVSLRLTQSDSVVGPGSRVTLTAQITLPKDVHVYAPGAQGYKAVTLQPNPTEYMKADATRYPKSHTLYLAAIKEKVPVFSGTFRITQDVTVPASPEFIRNLRAAGSGGKPIEFRETLFYQACNDTICFLPEKVPVAWQFTPIPLDGKRASEAIRHPGNP
jgi:AhpC/TSA family protein/cytochrome c biogenesis DsbD-like protein